MPSIPVFPQVSAAPPSGPGPRAASPAETTTGDTQKVPEAPDKTLPRQLEEQIESIRHWALANQKQARWEGVLFWSLKVPVIAASAGYLLMLKYEWEVGIAILGAVASMCALIDGFARPGALRNFHHRAYFELTALIDEIWTRWQSGTFSPKFDHNKLAHEVFEHVQKEKKRITLYLSEAEQAELRPSKSSGRAKAGS